MPDTGYTPFERAFRTWILVSAVAYGFAVPFFFLLGGYIAPVANALSAGLLSWPLYPLPPDGEGAFWRVLSVSMMAMLTWVCVKIYQDVRRYQFLTPIILLSKSCSTGLYLLLFVKHSYLAYLIGALTDGPIFVATLILWYLAWAGDQFVDERETEILAAIGDAFIPRGGPFALGFLDLREASIADTRRMLAGQDSMAILMTRLMLRTLDALPIVATLRWRTLRDLPTHERSLFLLRLEGHRSALFRMMAIGAKTYALVSFFNQPEAAQAVGYDPNARILL